MKALVKHFAAPNDPGGSARHHTKPAASLHSKVAGVDGTAPTKSVVPSANKSDQRRVCGTAHFIAGERPDSYRRACPADASLAGWSVRVARHLHNGTSE